MSSMRNAVQRRNHKERAQPLGREKWGLLEKHKDYALRAKDHKNKQKQLKILREKAALANPDEFSFKMMSSKTKNGQRIADRGNKALSADVVRLLKTQDAGYVGTMLQKTKKERERLEYEIQLVSKGNFVALKSSAEDVNEEDFDDENDPVAVKRTAFVDSKDEQHAMLDSRDATEYHTTSRASQKMSRKEAEAERQADILAGRAEKKRVHQQEVRRGVLNAIRKREKDLTLANQEIQLQLAKMSNTVGGINKNGVKFKLRERKR